MACDMSWERKDEVARDSRRRLCGSEEAMVVVLAANTKILLEERARGGEFV